MNPYTDKSLIPHDSSDSYCEELQEIIGRRPAWIVRWGVSVITLIFGGVIAACCVVKYPETVAASIILSSDNPPIDLVAKKSGILDTVYVETGDTVMRGQLIAVIANSARYHDVRIVKGLLKDTLLYNDITSIVSYSGLNLGEIQSSWIELQKKCKEYLDYKRIDVIGRKQRLLGEQITHSIEYQYRLEDQRLTLEEDIILEQNSFNRDSSLYKLGALSLSEYERARQSYVSKKYLLEGFDANASSAYLSHLQLEQQIIELENQRTNEEADYLRMIDQIKNTLENQIVLWEDSYAIISPYEGIVSLQNVWSEGQYITNGDIVASIIPAKDIYVFGKMKVPSVGLGKVHPGQQVNIKLNGFPYLEFGIVKGTVKTISSVPQKIQQSMFYTVDVELPMGLMSSYRIVLPFVQNMDGNAEIVTDDMRLIEQFIRPIRSLFTNR